MFFTEPLTTRPAKNDQRQSAVLPVTADSGTLKVEWWWVEYEKFLFQKNRREKTKRLRLEHSELDVHSLRVLELNVHSFRLSELNGYSL